MNTRRLVLGLVVVVAGVASAASPENLLTTFEDVTDSVRGSSARALSCAWLASTSTALGDKERAASLTAKAAKLIAKAKPSPERGWASARLGATLAATGDREGGEKAFEDGLDDIVRGLRRKETAATARRALIAWFVALDSARGAVKDDLVDRGVTALVSLDAKMRAVTLEKAGAPLARLGRARRVREIVKDLIVSGELPLLHLEDAVVALDGQEPTPILDEKERAAVLAALQGSPTAIDEFAPPLVVALLRAEKDPWAKADELAKRFEATKHPYAALLVRYSGLLRLAELDDRAMQGDRLVSVLDAALAHATPDAPNDRQLERMRVVTRTLKLVPKLAPGARACELVRRILAEAEKEPRIYVANELYGACAHVAGDLPAGDDTRKLAHEVASAARARFDKGRAAAETGEGSSPVVLCEALEASVAALVKLGEPSAKDFVKGLGAACLEVVDKPRDAAHTFFPRRCFAACARAAQVLGDPEGAKSWIKRAVSGIDENPVDYPDLVLASLRALRGLDRDARIELATFIGRAAAKGGDEMSFESWDDVFGTLDEVLR